MKQKQRSHTQKKILEFLKQKKAAYVEDIATYLDQADTNALRKFTFKYTINRTLKTMARNGEILLQEIDGRSFARLTAPGRHKLRSLNLSSETNVMSMAWDGRWRMIILDVPESDKEKRNALRYILKKAGFVCLKNSVWISPHPFEHMLENMKADLGLTNEIMIIVTDFLDPETESAFRESFWG
jgi:DNA-binding transcriptional regulator PaaX